MIYPHNYERKIGIDSIRLLLKERCLSSLGKLLVDEMAFCKDAATINEWLEQVREFRRLRQERADVPLTFFFDVRPALKRIRLENTHFEVEELFDFRRSLDTIHRLVVFIRGLDEELDEDGHIAEKHYEALYRLADGVATFPILIQQADQIVDKFGHVRDTASPPHPSSTRYAANWRAWRDPSPARSTPSCGLLSPRAWSTRTSLPRCATAAWSFPSLRA